VESLISRYGGKKNLLQFHRITNLSSGMKS